MGLEGTTMTDRGVPGFRATGAGDTLALAVCWCPDEPWRLGEVLLFPAFDNPRVLGRGEAELEGHERVLPVRQRPGTNEAVAPLAIPRLSRHQLAIEVDPCRSLAVRNLGRCRLVHEGEAVEEAVVRPGEVLQVGSCLLLLCTLRPWEIRGVEAAHPFGEADPEGRVGESPAAWAGRAGREVPPCGEDVPLVARHLLRRMAEEDPGMLRFFDGPHPRLGPDLVRRLVQTEVPLEARLRASATLSPGNYLEDVVTPRLLLVDADPGRRTAHVRALSPSFDVVPVADADAATRAPPQRYEALVVDPDVPAREREPLVQWARAVAGCRAVLTSDEPDLLAALADALASAPPVPSVLPLQDGQVDLPTRTVTRGADRQPLTLTEARLLAYLAERAGRPVPRDELLTRVWGYRAGVESRTVDTTIRRLRKKIERDPREPFHVRTVEGVGYRFFPP